MLAADFGLVLDDWQAWVLEQGLGERPDGKWSAFEVGLIVPRQNGKGSVLEARELAGLFLFGEKLLIHSAHEAKTSKDHFARMEELLRGAGYDDSKVQYRRSNEEVSITIKATGAKLRFLTRTKGGGRGLGGDFVAFDEAYAVTEENMAAILPVLSARSMSGNPQLWYTSSAGDISALVLGRLRERGTIGEPRLAFFDWCAHPDAAISDRKAWAEANPGLGIRISEEFVAAELNALGRHGFARERLGIWDNPVTAAVIEPALWDRRADPDSSILGPMVFAVDSSPDRLSTSIAVCGDNADGVPHVEMIERGEGVSWAGERIAELVAKWAPLGVVIDVGGPAGALVPALQAAGIDPWLLSARDVVTACGVIYDRATDGPLAHTGDAATATALASSKKRPLGQGWAWGRKDPAFDITPLTAVTFALYGWTARAKWAPKVKPHNGKVWC